MHELDLFGSQLSYLLQIETERLVLLIAHDELDVLALFSGALECDAGCIFLLHACCLLDSKLLRACL